MPYTPLPGNAANVNFTQAGYVPPPGNAANVNFTDVAVNRTEALLPQIYALAGVDSAAAELDETTGIIAVGGGDSLLEETYAIAGQTPVDAILDERFAFLGQEIRTAIAEQQWTANGVPVAIARLDQRWTLAGVGLATHIKNARWAATGVRFDYAILGQRWAVEFQPSAVILLDQEWGIAAPATDAAELDEQWAAASPDAQQGNLDQLWASAVWEVTNAELDESWRFNMLIARAWEIVYGTSISRAWDVRCDLGKDGIARGWEIDAPMSVTIKRGWEIDSAMQADDAIARAWDIDCPMIDDAVIVAAAPPTVTVRGQTIVLDTVEISIEEGQYAWSCQMTLQDPAHYLLFGADEPFTVTLGAEDYAFIRSEPQFTQNGQVDINATISGLNPGAAFADPRGEKLTRTWDSPTLVSAVLEELFGAGAVELRVLDWSIPANRLGASGQTAVEIAQAIARATGGFLESEPDGSLYIRYAWPVSAQFLDAATPDQVYNAPRDTFKSDDHVPSTRIANRIRILDSAGGAEEAILAAKIDDREDGYNGGRTSFVPGDQPALLIFKSEPVTIDAVKPSAGSIAPLTGGMMEVTETLQFSDSAEATLQYPTAAIDSYKWLGNDLGSPALSDDIKVGIAAAGVGMLQVTYQTAFIAKRVSGVPAVLNGETEYDVLVVVEGSTA